MRVARVPIAKQLEGVYVLLSPGLMSVLFCKAQLIWLMKNMKGYLVYKHNNILFLFVTTI